MNRVELPLEAFQLERSTQVRAGINRAVVVDYANRMRAGSPFPPIVAYFDGSTYYVADGFHRIEAAREAGLTTFLADVTPGGQLEALWCGLHSNDKHGRRLTTDDIRHAAHVAVRTWPNKSPALIAAQIGCTKQYVGTIRREMEVESLLKMAAVAAHTNTLPVKCEGETAFLLPDRVTGADGKSYPARKHAASSEKALQLREQATAMFREGLDVETVRAATGIGRDGLRDARRDAGIVATDKSKAAVASRRATMREMAASNHTSVQIAAAVGLSVDGVRIVLRQLGVAVHADKVTRQMKRPDTNRILERIVEAAGDLTDGVNLVDFTELDHTRVAEWLRGLKDARNKLAMLITRLTKEHEHGQAA